MDRIRNEYIRGRAQVEQFGESWEKEGWGEMIDILDEEDGAASQEERRVPQMGVAMEDVKMIGVTGIEAAGPGEMEV